MRQLVFSIVGIETYPDQLEPENQNAAIWRFLNMRKFRDVMVPIIAKEGIEGLRGKVCNVCSTTVA